MATFLQLCQDIARDSGSVSGVRPTTVVSQTGLLFQIVRWVNDAWLKIQNDRDHWEWMRSSWQGSAEVGSNMYSPTGLGITDHGRWLLDSPGYFPTTVFLDDAANEGLLTFISYNEWRTRYGRGLQTSGRPEFYSISPNGRLLVGPTPDDEYTFKGEYFTVPQSLSADSDVPAGLPARYHDVIRFRALMELHGFDEANASFQHARMDFSTMMQDIVRTQTPQITMNFSPLA